MTSGVSAGDVLTAEGRQLNNGAHRLAPWQVGRRDPGADGNAWLRYQVPAVHEPDEPRVGQC